MKLFKSTLSIILALSLIFAELQQRCPKAITMGTLDGTKYTNEFFGLDLNVPESWHIATEEEKLLLRKQARKLLQRIMKTWLKSRSAKEKH